MADAGGRYRPMADKVANAWDTTRVTPPFERPIAANGRRSASRRAPRSPKPRSPKPRSPKWSPPSHRSMREHQPRPRVTPRPDSALGEAGRASRRRSPFGEHCWCIPLLVHPDHAAGREYNGRRILTRCMGIDRVTDQRPKKTFRTEATNKP